MSAEQPAGGPGEEGADGGCSAAAAPPDAGTGSGTGGSIARSAPESNVVTRLDLLQHTAGNAAVVRLLRPREPSDEAEAEGGAARKPTARRPPPGQSFGQ